MDLAELGEKVINLLSEGFLAPAELCSSICLWRHCLLALGRKERGGSCEGTVNNGCGETCCAHCVNHFLVKHACNVGL